MVNIDTGLLHNLLKITIRHWISQIEKQAQLDRFFARAFPPDIDTFWRLGPAVLDTIQIGIVGTFLGILLSLVLGALAAKNTAPSLWLSYALKAAFGLTRAIPALVWALLFIVAVGLGPLPGILALAVNSVGMLGKIFAETFEDVDNGVIEALRSTGAGPVQIFAQCFVPETLPKLISWSIFRLDINIRYASILGIVGAGGIGWELSRAARMGVFSRPSLLHWSFLPSSGRLSKSAQGCARWCCSTCEPAVLKRTCCFRESPLLGRLGCHRKLASFGLEKVYIPSGSWRTM